MKATVDNGQLSLLEPVASVAIPDSDAELRWAIFRAAHTALKVEWDQLQAAWRQRLAARHSPAGVRRLVGPEPPREHVDLSRGCGRCGRSASSCGPCAAVLTPLIGNPFEQEI